jgi:hypothetical protein
LRTGIMVPSNLTRRLTESCSLNLGIRISRKFATKSYVVYRTPDAMNDPLVVGILGVVMGVLLVVFRKPFARDAVRQQNAFWGFRFGEREVRISERVAVLVGISSIGFWSLVST